MQQQIAWVTFLCRGKQYDKHHSGSEVTNQSLMSWWFLDAVSPVLLVKSEGLRVGLPTQWQSNSDLYTVYVAYLAFDTTHTTNMLTQHLRIFMDISHMQQVTV